MIDVARMPLQHLALACKSLTITTSAEKLIHDKAQTSSSIPASLHFLFETGTEETVSLIWRQHVRKPAALVACLTTCRRLQCSD